MAHDEHKAYPRGPYFFQKLRPIGSALFRFLQHSTEGDLGDTDVNRVLLADDAVKLMGDAAGNENNEAVRLGSFTATGPVTARSTAAQGTAKGWTDPDGSSNGVNTVTLDSSNPSVNVTATNRLWCNVGDPTAGSNVDAWDDLYNVSFKMTADSGNLVDGDLNPLDVRCGVRVEYSTDGGSNWTELPTEYVVTTISGTNPAEQNITITVAGSPSTLRVRLNMTGSVFGTPAAGSGSTSVQVFSSVWLTDTYPITWETSGTVLARRGLKLFNRGAPHALLDPLPTMLSNSDGIEGELAYVGGTVHGLFAKRDDRWYPLMLKDAVKCTNSSNLTVANNTAVVVAFNAEAWARGGNAIHSTSTNNSRITPVVPGVYLFTAVINWDSPASTWNHRVTLRKNGTTVVAVAAFTAVSATSIPWGSVISAFDVPSPGDFYELVVQQVSGASRTVQHNSSGTLTQFCASLIS